MKGPAPQPLGLKKLHGNPDKVSLARIPDVLTEAPDAPPHLPPEARAEWDRIVPQLLQMNVLGAIDRAALAGYCAAWARHVRAELQIQKFESELVRTPNGAIQTSPWVTISNRSLELMHRYMCEFGMTPAARVRLGRAPKPDKNPLPKDPDGSQEPSLDAFLSADPDQATVN
jgi:P27 family predicted phage terminase small subunit